MRRYAFLITICIFLGVMPAKVSGAVLLDTLTQPIIPGEPFVVPIRLTQLQPSQLLYLQCAFANRGSDEYFGATKIHGDWVELGDELSPQLQIPTGGHATWNGTIECMLPITAESSVDFDFKVGQYTNTGVVTWSNLMQVNTTKELSATPTPVDPIFGSLVVPSEVIASSPYEIVFTPKSVQNSVSTIKVEAKTESSNEWTAARTISDEAKALAWNASWSSLPMREIQNDHEVKVSFTLDEKYIDSVVQVRLKLRDSLGKTTVSPARNVSVKAKSGTTGTESLSAEKLIHDVRETAVSSKVIVSGTVSAQPDLLGSKSFYIEDETGGIKVVWDNEVRKDINFTDLVLVEGEVKEAFQESYIKASEVTVQGKGQVFAVLAVQTGAVGEEQEGDVIQIAGKIAATSGDIFSVDDGSGPVSVYIKESAKIQKPAMKRGESVHVTGIVSQYNANYRILPRFVEDIVMNPLQGVLGATNQRQLPKTGHNYVLIGLSISMLGFGMKLLSRMRTTVNLEVLD